MLNHAITYLSRVSALDKRSGVIGFIFAILLASASSLASNIVNRDSAGFSFPGTYLAIAALVPCFFILLLVALSYLSTPTDGINSLKSLKHANYSESRREKLFRFLFISKWSVAILSLIVLVLWLPAFLLTYPGIWTFDTIYQTKFLLDGSAISAHHPVIHTIWLSASIYISKILTGDYSLGLAFYTLTQMILLALCLGATVRTVARWNVPKIAPVIILLFFGIFPGFSLWSVVATKDVLFFGLFGLSMTLLIDVVLQKKQGQIHKASLVLFWVVLLLMCLFRNNGVYGLALFLVYLLIVYRKYWKSITAFFISVIACVMLITGPISSALGIQPGSKREMMSVPAVQMARVLVKAKNVSDSDKAYIESIVPNWEKYTPTLADSVKGSFQIEKVTSNPQEFVKNYLQLGLKYPGIYTTAALSLNIGFWAPFNNYAPKDFPERMTPIIVENRSPDEQRPEDEYIYIKTDSKLGALYPYVVDEQQHRYELLIPGLATIFQTGTWVWVCVLFAFACIHQRKYNLLIPAIFLGTYWFTLMLGPVSIYRYSNVIFVCAPVLLAVLAAIKRNGDLKKMS